MGASNHPDLAIPKGETRKRTKAREKRAERAVVQTIRPQVEQRDGYCRLYWLDSTLRRRVTVFFGACHGRSEWAHFDEKKRFKTRGMDPVDRHTTAGSLMLCVYHHDQYDEGRLHIGAKTERGCDGNLVFERDGETFDEETAGLTP